MIIHPGCVFSHSKLMETFLSLVLPCFPALSCCMLLSRAWLLRVFPRLAVTCFSAWLLRVIPRLAVTCFLVLGCYVFSWSLGVFLRLAVSVFPHLAVFFRAWLLRVFSCLAFTCFPAPLCYVFSRAWQLHTEADKGRSQNILKIRKRKFKSEI